MIMRLMTNLYATHSLHPAAGGSRSRHPQLITELNWNPDAEKDEWRPKDESRPGW